MIMLSPAGECVVTGWALSSGQFRGAVVPLTADLANLGSDRCCIDRVYSELLPESAAQRSAL
jgi:hypothetical protein